MSTECGQRPASLYKYRPWMPQAQRQTDGSFRAVNYTENLLRDTRFYCQGPRDFDDPHDSHTGAVPTGSSHDIDRFVVENMASAIAAMHKSGLTSLTQLASAQTPEAEEAIRQQAGRNERRTYRILCLSAVWDSELMWAFYADNHRGICIEFDATSPCFEGVERVQYAELPPAVRLGDPRPFYADALQKSLAWQHQQEWRLISNSEHVTFPKSALKRVILGYRFPETGFEPLVQILKAAEYQVEIAQMQRLPNSYQLIPVVRGRIQPK